jgi:hypothetical protein
MNRTTLTEIAMKYGLPALLGGLVVLGSLPTLAMDTGAVCLPYPVNPKYTEECGSCHVAYSPSLLPARSWRKTMASLDKHFDSDASIEEPVRVALERHLVENAMDSEEATCRMDMMNRGLSARDVPLRITATPYFRRIHKAIGSTVWQHEKVGSSANCGACHSHADKGRYASSELRLPVEIQDLVTRRQKGCM